MKMPSCLSAASVFVLALLFAPAAQAQDLTPPYVANRIADRTVARNTTVTRIKLTDTFNLSGVEGLVARFDTTLGPIDVLLRDDAAPYTVINFLNYVGSGAYGSSLVHRSVPGFIWQGGGYTLTPEPNIVAIPTDPPVRNESTLSNTRGTIAMAKVGNDPNSATSQWFFNEVDNSANLDTQNGGFTVFGQVITNGLDVMDAIAAVPVPNPSPFNSPLDQIPLVDYTYPQEVQPENLVLINAIYLVPVVSPTVGGPALLTVRVTRNTNPGVVDAKVRGDRLVLTYTGAKGSAELTLTATDTAGSQVKTRFNVTKR